MNCQPLSSLIKTDQKPKPLIFLDGVQHKHHAFLQHFSCYLWLRWTQVPGGWSSCLSFDQLCLWIVSFSLDKKKKNQQKTPQTKPPKQSRNENNIRWIWKHRQFCLQHSCWKEQKSAPVVWPSVWSLRKSWGQVSWCTGQCRSFTASQRISVLWWPPAG